MKTKDLHIQCLMERVVSSSVFRTTSFIPAKYAKVGKVLKLRETKNSEWVDGWVVVKVGAKVYERLNPESSIRQHRKNTGDSNPKTKGL